MKKESNTISLKIWKLLWYGVQYWLKYRNTVPKENSMPLWNAISLRNKNAARSSIQTPSPPIFFYILFFEKKLRKLLPWHSQVYHAIELHKLFISHLVVSEIKSRQHFKGLKGIMMNCDKLNKIPGYMKINFVLCLLRIKCSKPSETDITSQG